ncbi:MAG: CapA family protein [Lachnospiraceae bacterium]|nr:CapA family protein [Lachnospiraceae bacterium]
MRSSDINTYLKKKRRKRMMRVSVFLAFFVLLLALGYVFLIKPIFNEDSPVADNPSPAEETQQTPDPMEGTAIPEEVLAPEPEEEPFEEFDIHVMMVGDDLLHMGLVNQGILADGTRNYDFLFKDILDYIDAADIAIINQESPIGGNERGFTGYPAFNSPTEAADAIAKAGFDVVLTATNHTYDQGLGGLIYFHDYFYKYPQISVVGTHSNLNEDSRTSHRGSYWLDKYGVSPNDRPRFDDLQLEPEDMVNTSAFVIREVNGIKIAILNYTYSHNWATWANGLDGYLNRLCYYDPATREIDFDTINPEVLADIKLAREVCDIVIVCPHWGYEYSFEPCAYQKDFARQMIDAGADVIIGAHPHIVEPVEYITTENGNSGLCYYSLGNFIHCQVPNYTSFEGMAWVTIHVDKDGAKVDLDNSGALPMVEYQTWGPLYIQGVYPLEDFTADMASHHAANFRDGGGMNLDLLHQWDSNLFGPYSLTKEDILGAN